MKQSSLRWFSLVAMLLLFTFSATLLPAQNSTRVVAVRQIFPRQSTYEFQMLRALRINPENTVYAYDAVKNYSELSLLQKAFGRLALNAAEIFAMDLKGDYDAAKLINDISRINEFRNRVNAVLCMLVMSEVSKNSTDPSTLQLKGWATILYRNMKIRSAEAVLNEFRKWQKDPCSYRGQGYKPDPGCATGNMSELFSSKKPPQDIIAVEGLKSLYNSNANLMAALITSGLYTLTTGVAAAALSSSMASSFTAGLSSGGLYAAFTGNIGTMAAAEAGAGVEAGAEAILGATGWASVVAQPVAAAIMIIVVGTIEGFNAVETARVEPMLKMRLGAAMSDRILIANALADQNGRDMFFMAFMEASNNSYQVSPYLIDGEVRFFCQAGYVSKFKVSYDENIDRTGIRPTYQHFETETRELAVGNEQSFTIPAKARNIKFEGSYLLGDWKQIFSVTATTPAYYCYTSYGTIGDPKYKSECPEVASIIGKSNQLTVTQGGAYVAWITLRYFQNNKEVEVLNNQNVSLGWHKTYDIPSDARNITLSIMMNPAKADEPWRLVYRKTWPEPPNECIKVSGTIFEGKASNECN
jgi:hypothetical protein